MINLISKTMDLMDKLLVIYYDKEFVLITIQNNFFLKLFLIFLSIKNTFFYFIVLVLHKMVDSEYSPRNYKSLKISIELIIKNPEMLRFAPDQLKIKL